MAYNSSIPAPADRLSKSQTQLLNNFIAIKSLVEANHGAFDSADEGKHTFLQMPVQGSAPSTSANELGLYTKDDSSGDPQMYLRRQSSGSEIEFTGSLDAQNGWTRLPSGILIKWGRTTPAGAGDTTVTLPTGAAIPAFSSAFTAFTTLHTSGAGVDPNTAVYVYDLTTTSFKLHTTTRTSGAIGTVLVDYLIIGN